MNGSTTEVLTCTSSQLFLRESGDPDGLPVVFLHGGSLSSKMWLPQLERLAAFHCLAPDLPGHGQSAPDEPFVLKEAARQVADLIREKTPEGKASLVGISLGGAVALTLLREDPQVVSSVMVSGAAARQDHFTGQLSLTTSGALRFVSPERQAEIAMRQFDVPQEYQPLVIDDLRHSVTEAYSRSMVVALMSMDLPEAIACPFLVAVGEHEAIPARQAARKLLQMYPEAKGIIAPKMNQLWNLQDPELFNQTVTAWVAGQPLPDRLRFTGAAQS